MCSLVIKHQRETEDEVEAEASVVASAHIHQSPTVNAMWANGRGDARYRGRTTKEPRDQFHLNWTKASLFMVHPVIRGLLGSLESSRPSFISFVVINCWAKNPFGFMPSTPHPAAHSNADLRRWKPFTILFILRNIIEHKPLFI